MKTRHALARTGFTMIELMVVVTVITILAAISLQVVGGLIFQARHSATVATIEKIERLLDTRAQALDRQLQRAGYLKSTIEWELAGQTNPTANLQKILAIKLLEAKFFPQYAAEMQDQPITLNNQTFFLRMMPLLYPDFYQRDSQGNLTGTPKAELNLSAEIMFGWVNANVLGNSPVGQDQFSAAEVADTDGDGLQEIVDAWGTPLRFYRWPTRLFRPTGTGGAIDVPTVQQLFSTLPVFSGSQPAQIAQDLARDPDDPLQYLSSVPGFEGSAIATTPVLGHTPVTYHVFLVVSAGPDQTFGMGAPDDTTNGGWMGEVVDPVALQDDIVHLNIRAGGK